MKTYLAGLQGGTVGSTYLNSRWSALGRMNSKTINSSTVYGPALTGFIDTQTQQTFAPDLISYVPGQNLLFAIAAISATPTVYAYNFNQQTGVNSYIGKIILGLTNTPLQTHVEKAFWAWSDGTNVRIGLATTGTTNQQIGAFVTYTTLSAFTTGGTSCYPATATGQTNATYFLNPGDYYGLTYNTTTQVALGFDYMYLSSNSAVNTKAVLLDATVAAPRYLVWDLATTPQVAGSVINGVSSSATFYPGTSPNAFFTMSSQNGYSTTVPIAGAMENVIMMAGTGATPTVTGVNPYVAGTFQSTTLANTAAIRDLQQTFTLNITTTTGTITAGATITINGIAFISQSAYSSGVSSIVVTSPAGWNGITVPTNGATGTVSAGTQTTIVINASSGVVPGSWYFNLSVPATLTAITPTASSNFTIMRANGLSTNMFYGRTPVAGFTPAISGAAVINMLNYAKPVSTPALGTLAGNDCLSVVSTTGLALQKFTDLFQSVTASLTSGSTTITFSSPQSMQNGSAVYGPGIVAGTIINGATTNSTTAILSVAATSNQTTQSYVIGNSAMASYTSVNITGTGIDVVAPALALGRYTSTNLSTDIDKFVYLTNTSSFVMKTLQNSSVLAETFGGMVISYLEGNNPVTVQFGEAVAPTCIEARGGWLFFASFSQVGQRGIFFMDALSHNDFGYTALISPILNVPAGTTFRLIQTLEQLFDYTDSASFWIRNAPTSTDTSFNTANIPMGSSGPTSNGWTLIKTAQDLSTTAIGPYFQLCVTPQILTFDANTPAQIQDIAYTVTRYDEMSDNWEGSVDNTTQNGASPSYTAFRLQTAYASSVPTLYFRAYDDNGNLVASANTVSNPTLFNYSTNNGTSWAALGTIPNTALTTEVRYNWPSPPGVRITCSIRES